MNRCRNYDVNAHISDVYHVIISRQSMSWEDANTLCTKLNSTLPTINSLEDEELLTKLLLFPLVDDKTSFPRHECRHWDPLCMIYIGLKSQLV